MHRPLGLLDTPVVGEVIVVTLMMTYELLPWFSLIRYVKAVLMLDHRGMELSARYGKNSTTFETSRNLGKTTMIIKMGLVTL